MTDLRAEQRYRVTYRDGIGGQLTAELEYVGRGWWTYEGEPVEDRLELEYFRGDDGPVVVPVVLMLSAEPI